MASFVIDLDDSKERWEELYVAIAERGARQAREPADEPPDAVAVAAAPACEDSPPGWVLSSAHWNGR